MKAVLSSRLAFSCPGATQSDRELLGVRGELLQGELDGWSQASRMALT